MKKLFFLVSVFLYLVPGIKAQIDTEFWFAAPDLYVGHAEQPIWFCISTFDSPATVVFEQPANSSYTPMTFDLNANSFHVYDVSDIINVVETKPYNTILDYGFHIYSTAPVSVYYESSNNNSEIYSLKGTNALGTNFIVPSQSTYNNYYSLYSRIEVVATQDNTEVTFMPSVPVKDGLPSGEPITITLNRGQCYAIEAQGSSGSAHIRNTRVISNKPIAVNTSDDSVWCLSAQDLIGDQIVPVNLLGSDYLALWNNTPNEYLYFYPTQDNTQIYLDDSPTPVAILDVGQEFSYQLNTSIVYVHSDKPIAVFQLASDDDGELGGTVLPHISCTGSRKVVYKKNGTMDLTITVVVRSSYVNDFLINGDASYLTSSDFAVVPSNTEYSYCKKDVSQYVSAEGLITVENTNEDGYFQLGVLSMAGDYGTCSYGYFSDYHEYIYAEFDMDSSYYVGDDITFNIISANVDNLILILPDGTMMTQQPFVLSNVQANQAGRYQLQGESCNGVQILDEIFISIEEVFDPETNLPDNIDSANCVFFPEGTEWGIEVGWSSASIVSNLNSPFVGDLDNDGHPEIICFSMEGDSPSIPSTNNQILVFDGVTKHLKTTITLPSQVTAYDAAAYGMVKTSSGKGLIVTACYDYKLRAYDITASNPNEPYWVSDVDYGSNYGDWGVNLGFADFNYDGHPELYVRNKIYNAETGVLLGVAEGGNNVGGSYAHYSHYTNWQLSSPLAANVCNDVNPELILGNEIYSVHISNPDGTDGNNILLKKQITPPENIMSDGHAQVADFNMDGYMDVFISLRNTAGYYGNVYAYIWDVHNNTVSSPLTISTLFSGKSIPMIADINNDGFLEVLIQCDVYGNSEKFQAYRYDYTTDSFSLIWGFATDEDSYSNSITSFDFNQDGLLELMICDQSTVRIVNGSGFSHITGNDTIPIYVMSFFPFSETTIMQYPIIVDVDDDGNAEIVSVGSDKLNIFESSGSPWAPARKVWNQYMYNVTNINNDLTVSQYQFSNAIPFTDPDGVVRRPFNNFLQQATTIDQYGRPFFAVPDVVVEPSASSQIIGADSLAITLSYCNTGDNTLNAPYAITVFADSYGHDAIFTATVNEGLPVDSCTQSEIRLPLSALCGFNDIENLAIVVNCAGIGIAQNGGQQPECDTTNNVVMMPYTSHVDITDIFDAACDSYDWYEYENITESGDYTHSFTNISGCDSIVTLHLTINPSYTTNIDITACDEYEWFGETYNISGQYTHMLNTVHGCDSLIILDLTISNNQDLEIDGLTQVAISSDLWPGIYSYCLADSTELQQCDITWTCSNHNWIVLPSENPYWFNVIINTLGSGTLTATVQCESGCDAIASFEINASYLDVDDIDDNTVLMYPNPANNILIIKGNQLKKVTIYDFYGQKLSEVEVNESDEITIDTGNLANGLYITDIVTTRGKTTKRLMISK